MGKIVERYQVLFGFMLGSLILGMILGGTFYLLKIKGKFASPAYANPDIAGSKAIADFLGVDKDGYPYFLTFNGLIKKSDLYVTDVSGINGGFINELDINNPVTAVLPFDDGYYAIKADGTYIKKENCGFRSAPAAVFQNGRWVHFCNSKGDIIKEFEIYPPAKSIPNVDIRDVEIERFIVRGLWAGSKYRWGIWDTNSYGKNGYFEFWHPWQRDPPLILEKKIKGGF